MKTYDKIEPGAPVMTPSGFAVVMCQRDDIAGTFSWWVLETEVDAGLGTSHGLCRRWYTEKNLTLLAPQPAPVAKQPLPDKPLKAPDFLRAGAQHMEDRAATYDKPEGERSMAATVAAFHAITGCYLSEEQGWLFMALLKAVRSQQGAFKADNYEDGAAYFGLAGEAAARSRT